VERERSVFTFDDSELDRAQPPGPMPHGADEWRRPFWLMRTLKGSMQHGGYLTPDARVYVPRRVWMQRGARFTGMAAKLECAQCLLTEFTRAHEVDYRQREVLQVELDRLCETFDAVQASLHRLLPFVPEPRAPFTPADQPSTAVSKLTDRFKGLAKTLDKTAARLGALPAKCHDPGEYVGECPL
jgi:hypothetical protein